MNAGRRRVGSALVGLVLAAAAAVAGQDAVAAEPAVYSADRPTQLLGPSPAAAPSFTADQFRAILAPPVAMRSLTPGEGAAVPGEPGSGIVPDLKINFAFNSADLTPASRATLDELAKAMASDELAGMTFEIAGHTDATGGERYNDELSRRRAAAVAGYLTRRPGGPARGRLDAHGYGEHRLWDRADPANPLNRRVEVRVEG